MSDYASQELSAELQMLSGWVDVGRKDGVEQYTAGYLLRKLPQGKCTMTLEYGDWNYPSHECLWRSSFNADYSQQATTPEDALCALAIELHKAGILPISGRDL